MRALRWALAMLPLLAGPTAADGWDHYEIIMWHTQSAAALAGARRLGATAAMMLGLRDDPPSADTLRARAAPLLAAGLRPYVENLATDVFSAYHRWQPDHALTWRFALARAAHRRDPHDRAAFIRAPGLSDPAWRARIAARLAAHVQALAADPPLFFDLGDETGIADLTAAWDFDVSPDSLAAFRLWLRDQYGSLAALNAEWGTGFASWQTVQPLLTDAAIQVHDGNFAAWADFKAFMDTAFAAALRAATAAVHAADPAARAGIEGAQTPGCGGYDVSRLADAVDVMEVADPMAFEIAHALNPRLILLTTSDGTDPAALWRAALAGSRGVILWDPDAALVRADGTPGPRGPALAPLLAELGGAVGHALVTAAPARDPVAILYSPASFRTEWLLARQADGQDWATRTSDSELEDTPLRHATRQALDALLHLGITPHWLTPEMLAGDGLAGLRVLLLPQALALSAAERAAIGRFIASGGTVLADTAPGAFDAHSRRRAAALAGVTLVAEFSAATLTAAGVAPPLALRHPDGTAVTDVTLRRLRQPDGTPLLALLRDPAPGTEAVVLTLPQPHSLRDLRTQTPARRSATLTLHLSATAPALLAIGR